MSDQLISIRLLALEILLLKNDVIDQKIYFQILNRLCDSLPSLSLSEAPQQADAEISLLADLLDQLHKHQDTLKKALNQ